MNWRTARVSELDDKRILTFFRANIEMFSLSGSQMIFDSLDCILHDDHRLQVFVFLNFKVKAKLLNI